MTNDTHPFLRFGPAIVITLLITALSLLPAQFFKQVSEPLPQLPVMDKIVHALMYAALTATYLHSLPRDRRSHLTTVLRVVVIAALYGIAMEVCQKLLTTSRTMDPLDALANAVGALAYALPAFIWANIRSGRLGQTPTGP